MATAGITWNAEDVERFAQGEDMSSGDGLIVVDDSTAGQVIFADAVTESVLGVIVTESNSSTTGATVGVVPVSSGKVVRVKVDGSGTAIVYGDLIGASTTDGIGIKTTTDGHHVVGRAREATTAANVFIKVAMGLAQRAS